MASEILSLCFPALIFPKRFFFYYFPIFSSILLSSFSVMFFFLLRSLDRISMFVALILRNENMELKLLLGLLLFEVLVLGEQAFLIR